MPGVKMASKLTVVVVNEVLAGMIHQMTNTTIDMEGMEADQDTNKIVKVLGSMEVTEDMVKTKDMEMDMETMDTDRVEEICNHIMHKLLTEIETHFRGVSQMYKWEDQSTHTMNTNHIHKLINTTNNLANLMLITEFLKVIMANQSFPINNLCRTNTLIQKSEQSNLLLSNFNVNLLLKTNVAKRY
jgi:hypothetical protein